MKCFIETKIGIVFCLLLPFSNVYMRIQRVRLTIDTCYNVLHYSFNSYLFIRMTFTL